MEREIRDMIGISSETKGDWVGTGFLADGHLPTMHYQEQKRNLKESKGDPCQERVRINLNENVNGYLHSGNS